MEMLNSSIGLVECRMGKVPKRQYRPLFVVEWISFTGHKIPETAKAIDVTQSYIRNLGAGRRANPSGHVLLAISEHLGVTMNDFYRKPPTDEVIEQLRGLSPGVVESLVHRRKRQ